MLIICQKLSLGLLKIMAYCVSFLKSSKLYRACTDVVF